MRRTALLLLVILTAWCVRCCAEGLDALIEVGKNMGEIQKGYDLETKNFERVKKAFDSGAIKKGQAKGDIAKQYGDPVIVTKESGPMREKWVYKPASSSFFDGIRIYLFFDESGALDEIKVVQ